MAPGWAALKVVAVIEARGGGGGEVYHMDRGGGGANMEQVNGVHIGRS